MIRVKRPPKPTLDQSKWLRRIAQTPMIKTYVGHQMPVFHLSSGEEIPVKIAMALIGNGWVRGQRDGMFDDPQSYVVLKPQSCRHDFEQVNPNVIDGQRCLRCGEWR